MSAGQREGRTPQHEHIRRRKQFIRLLSEGVDPFTAAEQSGQPPAKALETIGELYRLGIVTLEDAA